MCVYIVADIYIYKHGNESERQIEARSRVYLSLRDRENASPSYTHTHSFIHICHWFNLVINVNDSFWRMECHWGRLLPIATFSSVQFTLPISPLFSTILHSLFHSSLDHFLQRWRRRRRRRVDQSLNDNQMCRSQMMMMSLVIMMNIGADFTMHNIMTNASVYYNILICTVQWS